MEESKFQIPWRTESVVSFAPCLDALAAHIGLHRYFVPWNFHAYQMVEYASNEYIMFRITTRDEDKWEWSIRIVLFNAVEVQVR